MPAMTPPALMSKPPGRNNHEQSGKRTSGAHYLTGVVSNALADQKDGFVDLTFGFVP